MVVRCARGKGEEGEVDAQNEGNSQVEVEESAELHGFEDTERGRGRKEKEKQAANEHDPSNQCDQDGQGTAGPDVVREDDGESAGERDNGEDYHGRAIAEKRGDGGERRLALDEQPKTSSQREQAEEAAQVYGERFHSERILQRIPSRERLSCCPGISVTHHFT